MVRIVEGKSHTFFSELCHLGMKATGNPFRSARSWHGMHTSGRPRRITGRSSGTVPPPGISPSTALLVRLHGAQWHRVILSHKQITEGSLRGGRGRSERGRPGPCFCPPPRPCPRQACSVLGPRRTGREGSEAGKPALRRDALCLNVNEGLVSRAPLFPLLQ